MSRKKEIKDKLHQLMQQLNAGEISIEEYNKSQYLARQLDKKGRAQLVRELKKLRRRAAVLQEEFPAASALIYDRIINGIDRVIRVVERNEKKDEVCFSERSSY